MEFLKGIWRVILGFFGKIPKSGCIIIISNSDKQPTSRHGTGGLPQPKAVNWQQLKTLVNGKPNKNGRIYPPRLFKQMLNPKKVRICLSSKEAFFLTEDEYLAFINKKVLVEVVVVTLTESKNKFFIPLEEFMKEFQPELYEKYKLLIEEKN